MTTQGLTGQEVRTLTKHRQDVFDKDYLCELSISCMTTMAGFRPKIKHDKYYVPRATIGLPNSMTGDDLAKILFPMLDLWREDQFSHHGDKTTAANNFLNSVLPYLAEVMVQDGVLWMRNHKDNPSIRLLDQLLHGETGDVNYTTWGQQKVIEINQKVQRHEAEVKAAEDMYSHLVEVQEQRRTDQQEVLKMIEEMVSTRF